eukprot:Skav227900  [mRNA]  locus=scaffold4087:195308:196270:+ [translate_table: standard]
MFCSDIDPRCRAVLNQNFKPLCIYEDVTTRDHSLAPESDLYGAGFPCVGFSRVGKKEGFLNLESQAGLHSLLYIKIRQPKGFLLENVSALLSERHKDDFELIMNFLLAIKHPKGGPLYNLHYEVMNSINHGLPQSRPRIYIVGLQYEKRKFTWPNAEPKPSLENFLQGHSDSKPEFPTSKSELKQLLARMTYLKNNGMEVRSNAVVDLGYGFESESVVLDQCPCLTRSHCRSNSYFSLRHLRKLRLPEYLKLQGIPADRLSIPAGVDECHVREMCGNAFSVPVIAKIVDRMLFSLGFIDKPAHRGAGQDGHKWPQQSVTR